jgi:hypothetical protein
LWKLVSSGGFEDDRALEVSARRVANLETLYDTPIWQESELRVAVPGMFKTQGIHEFVPADWFRNPSDSSGWIRIYSSLGLGHAAFHEQMDAAFSEVQDCPFGVDQPVGVSYGQLAGFETSQLSWFLAAEQDGGTRCDVTILNGKLPLGNYVVFVLPCRVDGVDGDVTVIRAAMDQSVAALIAHMGRNLLRDVVYEGEVNAGGVHRKPRLPDVSIPQPSTAPTSIRSIGRTSAQRCSD